AWGRCPDSESPPYWPWSQALRALLGPSGRRVLDAEPAGRAGLFAAVAEALEAAATARPAVIVLEDVHWAEPSSLALLRFVVGIVPGLAAVLVLTARDDRWTSATGSPPRWPGCPRPSSASPWAGSTPRPPASSSSASPGRGRAMRSVPTST